MEHTRAEGSEARLLLLHGAGLGSWIWDGVLPYLDGPAAALDLPGRGNGARPGDVTLQQCIDFVAADVRHHDAPAIIVGHSVSAEVAIGAAAARPSHVAGVILVGGVVPKSGESFLSLVPFLQRQVLRLVLRRARNGVALPKRLVRREYCNDLDGETTALVLRRVTAEAPRMYLDPLDWSRLPHSLPVLYVKLLDDRSVPPKRQQQIIERLQARRVESLDSGHLPMLSRPRELADALNSLAASLPRVEHTPEAVAAMH